MIKPRHGDGFDPLLDSPFLITIIQDAECRQILKAFKDYEILTTDEIFAFVKAERIKVIKCLVELCSMGVLKAMILDPFPFFQIESEQQKTVRAIFEQFEA